MNQELSMPLSIQKNPRCEEVLRDRDRAGKLSAALVTIVVHAVVILILTLIIIPAIQPDEPLLQATVPLQETICEPIQPLQKAVMSKPASRSSTMPIINSVSPAAAITLPAVQSTALVADVGAGATIGLGFGNGASGDGRGGVGTLFGAVGGTDGLVGTFYDLKQTRQRQPTDCAPASGIEAYRKEVQGFFRAGWNPSRFQSFYRAPTPLVAGQLFIPSRPADAAPEAFGVQNEVQPSRWVVHYRGTVIVPQSMPFRFVGSGDDWLVVRWDRKIALDDGYEHMLVGEDRRYSDFRSTATGEFAIDRSPGTLHRLRTGPWITARKGTRIPIEILIGETPGGVFDAYLAIEVAQSAKASPDGNFTGEGKLKLLRFNTRPLPQEISSQMRGLNIDMDAQDWIFTAVRQAGF